MTLQANLAAQLAAKIVKIAKAAGNEEEVRIEVEKLIGPAREQLGIEISAPQYGRTLLTGKADAVYGNVIIEYEPPGKLSKKAGFKHARSQLEQYLDEAATAYGKQKEQALRRAVGIGLDGYSIFFLRYTKKKIPFVAFPAPRQGQQALFEAEPSPSGFHSSPVYPVTPETISLLLDYLRALSRQPLTPENLAGAFGPDSDVASITVSAFYQAITGKPGPKAVTLFQEWRRIFGVVYGEGLEKAEKAKEQLAKAYNIQGKVELQPLLFAVHTYFAFIMKLLAAEFASLQEGALLSSFVQELLPPSHDDLKVKLEELEEGGVFRKLHIVNFLEGDFFRWYLDVWDKNLAEAVRRLAKALANFEPATATLSPEQTKDLVKKLYQYLVPPKLRHGLGEYYTPDWLAERLLNQLQYKGDVEERILDPGCGSGTFLVQCIKRAIEFGNAKALDQKVLANKIVQNIVGFDLNPLAVIAARTNYLLALGPSLARLIRPLKIPVYLCDSVLGPTTHTETFGELFPEKHEGHLIPTTVEKFILPKAISTQEKVEALSELLEQSVQVGLSREQFVTKLKGKLGALDDWSVGKLRQMYESLLKLEKEKRNRIWVRIIKNNAAPIFVGEFDYVVGNPPWVNWQNLAADWREITKELWVDYGLFTLKGHAAQLGGGKKDLAMLFTYVATDKYLKKNGKLGFVLTQTLFKTKGAGDGFRRFQLGSKETFRVVQVDDMVDLQPFEGATNRTSVAVFQKRRMTDYPVPYLLWKRRGKRIPQEASLDEVIRQYSSRKDFHAGPVEKDKRTMPWLTAKEQALGALWKCTGPSAYKGWAGSCTWLSGVYWVRCIEGQDEEVLVENLFDEGDIVVKKETPWVERELVYPLLRGRDVQRWQATPSSCILVVQDLEERTGIKEEIMKERFPKTYLYMKGFEDKLRARSGIKKYFDLKKDPFYSMYNVGPYTVAEYKVVWREVAETVEAAVCEPSEIECLGRKAIVPDHTVILVSCSQRTEAHYLCAMLNSVISRHIVAGYIALHPSPHILESICIPQYDAENRLHSRLAQLSAEAHLLAGQEGKEDEVKALEEEIDEHAARLWGLTNTELKHVRHSLAELMA